MPRRASFDAAALEALLARQDRVITRAQALDCGLTVSAVWRRTEPGGPWSKLLPGIYLAATGVPTLDQREIAALRYAGEGSVITGIAALRRIGVRVPDGDRVTVLVPAGRPRKSCSFVTVWPTTRMPSQVMYRGVIQFAMPDRAAADAARELGNITDIRAVVADAVQRRWCHVERLNAELAAGPRRGRAPLRDVLAEVADGARSVAEGDLRKLLIAAGIPAPLFNASVYAGRDFVAKPDAWWPAEGVAVEVDSRAWHLLPADWQRTMDRHARMSAQGIIVLHFTPAQIRKDPAVVAARIRSALAAGRNRPALQLRTVPAA